MPLPSSLSNPKKFFQRSIQNVKSLFCGGTYQRLPKTSPSKPFSIENYFNREDQLNIFVKIAKPLPAAMKKKKKKKIIVQEGVIREEEIFIKTCRGDIIREERRSLLAKKLKELENMDIMRNNIVENVLDIEELLHYYSTLTCPVYIDIFDKFFVGIYSDLFHLKAHVQSS